MIVTVSSTGIVTPTLDAQVFAEMGFRQDAMRLRSTDRVNPDLMMSEIDFTC